MVRVAVKVSCFQVTYPFSPDVRQKGLTGLPSLWRKRAATEGTYATTLLESEIHEAVAKLWGITDNDSFTGHIVNKNHTDILETTIQSAARTRGPESYRKRLHNINFIKKLDRDGLEYQEREKQILIKCTNVGEKLYIQYPGKESSRNNPKPWDFRPELFKKDGETARSNFSFEDVWAILFQTLSSFSSKANKEEELTILATIFYRMAFMLDHVLHPKVGDWHTNVRDVANGRYSNERNEVLPNFYRYEPPLGVLSGLKELSKGIERYGDMSLEVCLHYNELLAWNEDCKYYYKKVEIGNEKWINKTGRVNTLLTYISIIGFMLGGIKLFGKEFERDIDGVKLANILSDFTRGRGVAPAKPNELKSICGGYIR